MHRQSFMLLVIVSVLACIFSLIYKQTSITQLLYQQQVLEKEHAQLLAQKAYLSQRLFQLSNATAVQEYAVNRLGMKKLTLAQVHRIQAGS